MVLPLSKSRTRIFSFAVLFLVIIGGVWVVVKSMKKPSPSDFSKESPKSIVRLEPVNDPEKQTLLPILSNGVTIKVFDEFCLWVDGQEIPQQVWGSKKARSLFLYILLKNSHGVTISEITLTFWPEVSRESAQNSRAVALSRIRAVLKEHAKVLKRKNGRIFMAPGETLSADYYHLIFFQPEKKTIEDGEQILDLYGEGDLLPGLGEDWLDSIRHIAQEKALTVARHCANYYRRENQWDKLYTVGQRILQWNSLNDMGLKYQIQAIVKKNNPALAHQVFNEFRENYRKEIEEPYTGTFENLLI